MQQNPDGSVTTHGATADRAPTWGELNEHVSSTGATLLPATPAQQPPPRPQAEEAPPPEAAPPAYLARPAPEPTRGEQAAASAEQAIREAIPPRPTARYLFPSTAAMLGAYALPVAAEAFLGPLGPFAQAGLAAMGAGVSGGTAEYGQAQAERYLYGEPPPGSPTPFERAVQFANVAAPVEGAVQVATPLALPVIQKVAAPFGSQAVVSATEAPVLSSGALGGEPGTIRGGQDVARNVAQNLEAGHVATSTRVGSAAPDVPIATDHLPPLVAQTRAALARQGATDSELAAFDQNMTPISQGGPQPLYKVLSAERHLNTWTARVPSQVPELHVLGTNTRNTITAGVEGTPAAQPWQNHLNEQAATGPTRSVLHQAADAPPEAFQPWLHAEGQQALDAIVNQAAPGDVKEVGRAWLASVRQGARTAVDPTQYVADAYNALPANYRTAMFGEQSPAIGQLIGAAKSAPGTSLLPRIGLAPVAQPWARGVLMSPTGAAFTRLGTGLATAGGRTALYTAAAQSEEPKPPP